MTGASLVALADAIREVKIVHKLGRISTVTPTTLQVIGLGMDAALGDQVEVMRRDGQRLPGEVCALSRDYISILPDGPLNGVAVADRVMLGDQVRIAPDDGWLGRVIDPMGAPLDGRPLLRGPQRRSVETAPPASAERRGLGPRLRTGLCAFDTVLPIVRGQRLGLFSGSGVGKSSLIANLAKGVDADVVVLALIGERGREVRHFVNNVLGPEGMKRAVVVAATSDQSPLRRRRCAWTAMAVAEHFRDRGQQVLLLADSVTRFAEAHREIALALGEPASLGGYPPSLAHAVMCLAERAGPGTEGQGDITALFSVLVAGSDMEGPVADILRGVLDGHIVLERQIAERGRFPAINLLKSVSRSLPDAASPEENALILEARQMLGVYDRAELMIQSGLYAAGSNPQIDKAVTLWDELDAFLAEPSPGDTQDSFARLRQCLRKPA